MENNSTDEKTYWLWGSEITRITDETGKVYKTLGKTFPTLAKAKEAIRRSVGVISFLLLCIVCHAQTISEVRAEIIRQGLPHPDIVLAQARLETGNFTSKMCRTKHNLFGIKHGRAYASYRRWQDCVTDYKRRISSRYKGGDYYAFLTRIGYAQDKNYSRKVAEIVRTSKH